MNIDFCFGKINYFSNFQALEKAGNIQKLEELVGEIKSKAAFEEIGIPEIKHFIYKSKSTAQFLSFSTDKYEKDAEAMTRLNNVYFIIQARLHSPTRPFKLLYFSGSLENVIAWVSQLLKDLMLPKTFKSRFPISMPTFRFDF